MKFSPSPAPHIRLQNRTGSFTIGNMACEAAADEQIGEALIFRFVKNELKRVIGGEVPLLAQFPLNVQYEKLVFELTENMESISDTLRNNTELNAMIDKIAQQRNPDILAKAAEMVFSDGVVNWGRIIVLLYTARRLSVKLWIAFEPEAGLDIFTSTLAYFKNILLAWIVKMGGWTSSLSEFERWQKGLEGIGLPRAAVIGGLLLAGCLLLWGVARSSC
ncbi:apoptosis regulator BAX-like [Denticeps clupeoides]|uniref:apoptosis regulator BAX-like n=1 Tax=Denticeps clupeoides TaxID=299321 RepID=UPI0010A41BE9|nr:apoptosis regulator BAX-like [Denticeps clupeoides]